MEHQGPEPGTIEKGDQLPPDHGDMAEELTSSPQQVSIPIAANKPQLESEMTTSDANDELQV